MRIPRRVDAALTLLERHGVVLIVALLLVAVAASLWRQPALAAFVVGGALGGFSVQSCLGGRLRKARRENDDLLRQNGALRHRVTVLSAGVIARGSQMTEALPVIPEGSALADRSEGTLPLPAATDPDDA